MMKFMRLSVLAAMLCAFIKAADDDIKYSDLDQFSNSLSIAVEYSPGVGVSCPQEDISERADTCAEVSWDDDDFINISFNLDNATTLDGAAITGAQVYRCFSKLFIKNRAWRKFKDIIRKDKQCKKIATVTGTGAQTYKYVIPSDAAEATYYFQVLVKCGDGKHDFCAKDSNVGDYYAVKPMDSIPAGLVVGVIVAVIIAPTFLVLYFIYEFGFKKQA